MWTLVVQMHSGLIPALGGCAGMCYNALWYSPVLLVMGGLPTLGWDFLPRQSWVRWLKEKRRPLRRSSNPPAPEAGGVELGNIPRKGIDTIIQKEPRNSEYSSPHRRQIMTVAVQEFQIPNNVIPKDSIPVVQPPSRMEASAHYPNENRSNLYPHHLRLIYSPHDPPRRLPPRAAPPSAIQQHATLVYPGWVSSPRLSAQAGIIQAMPGPNFNFHSIHRRASRRWIY
ncbi:hypothetical protein CPB84DRAFT_1782771 [Gymnopilus junonius]|uniref:Uncharacterized protein n=1 Tax=Gymnopilus junonius TaxID=109634 RepID=A0A9P5NK22_GYMJU|nr:hypothetical protein CPB84DRAFT_1782771 [Gymnopilus junonius]